jgi:hypothetical protein
VELIRFFPERNSQHLGKPEPMKNFIPEWYRKAEATWIDENGEEAPGLKKCVPYLDTLISGYAITTPADFYVGENEDGSLRISWDGPPELGSFIMERPEALGSTMARPAGHHHNHLVWSGVWGMKTPKGYSLLVTHPLNRFDLPFTTTSGIIDADEFFANGNIPFFMKAGFTGVIPKGTPIAQLIPIKRAKWKMIENDKGLLNGLGIQSHLVRQPETLYKRVMWHKKEFN